MKRITIMILALTFFSINITKASQGPINQYPGDTGGVTCVRVDLGTGHTVVPGWACADSSGNTYVCNNAFSLCRQGGDTGYCPWAGPSLGCGVP